MEQMIINFLKWWKNVFFFFYNSRWYWWNGSGYLSNVCFEKYEKGTKIKKFFLLMNWWEQIIDDFLEFFEGIVKSFAAMGMKIIITGKRKKKKSYFNYILYKCQCSMFLKIQ